MAWGLADSIGRRADKVLVSGGDFTSITIPFCSCVPGVSRHETWFPSKYSQLGQKKFR
jgi:hypothetical protein